MLVAAGVGVLALVLALALGGGGAGAPRPARVRAGERVYVDCSGSGGGGSSGGGSGAQARPLTSLQPLLNVTLRPGAELLLRRGSTCDGTLSVRGSGTASAPFVIGAYGSGTDPLIAAGSSDVDALTLTDTAHAIVEDLQITNRGDGGSTRRGIHVVARTAGAVHDVVIAHNEIHDVDGAENKNLGGSAGIQVDHPTANVLIEDNEIENVARSGIWVAGTGAEPRPRNGRPWPSASTGVVIRGNVVRGIGGDGIVPTGTAGAVIEGNTVCCGNLHGHPPAQFDAGIWTFDSNGTVIARNYVYNMQNAPADGTGYDIDLDQDGTVLESNYGYGNAGGFVLLCADPGPRTALVRGNVSVAEYGYELSDCGPQGSLSGTLAGIQIDDNTFLVPYAHLGHGSAGAGAGLAPGGGLAFSHNLIVGLHEPVTPLRCGPACAHNVLWSAAARR